LFSTFLQAFPGFSGDWDHAVPGVFSDIAFNLGPSHQNCLLLQKPTGLQCLPAVFLAQGHLLGCRFLGLNTQGAEAFESGP